MPVQWTKERVGEQGLADINARPPDEAELMRKKKWRFKKKRNGVKENEKMAIIKMVLTIRVDGAQAQSGGDEKRQREWRQ